MIFEEITKRETSISVIGLGYVGLPLAVAFSHHADVVGFDVNSAKIELLRKDVDPTDEIGDGKLHNGSILFTDNPEDIGKAKLHIIAVPTPVHEDKTPDLSLIKSASKLVGSYLQRGAIVVYESTVYPGVTNEVCIPLLEEFSGLICGKDFKVGYSPERINPSDKEHTLASIVKIVSGVDEESLQDIASVYELVAKAGVFRASSIKVAEAAKVIENCQRDINVAFVNELSIIFDLMGIDTKEVLEAANTKWNFMNFSPGLVGGHCIGVDPYYLTHKAMELGCESQVILAGRKINDGMGKYIAEKMVKTMIAKGVDVKNARAAILGFTFKENCADVRNTKVMDIVNELRDYGITVLVTDPAASSAEVKDEYGVELVKYNEVKDIDIVAVCVSHDEYRTLKIENIDNLYRERGNKIFFDVKGIFDKCAFIDAGYYYWRL
jgi:UDP-N-acetyl-D-galactosamine dehydrogenase